MSLDVLGDVNWLAIIVATLAYFALGGIWFARKVFGDIWTRSIGWDASTEESPGSAVYVGPLITCFVATLAIAMIAQAAGSDGVGDGIVLGIVAGLGIAGSVLFVTGYFDMTKQNPKTWFGVIGGYHLLGITIAAVILSVWT
jgi:hypothetical protein